MDSEKGERRTGKHFLTTTKVNKLVDPKENPKGGRYPDGGGLYLVIAAAPGVGRSWIFRYPSPTHFDPKGKAKQREKGLGPLAKTSLHAARRLAEELSVMVYEKKLDPIDEKTIKLSSPEKGAITFGEAAEKLIAARRPSWKVPKRWRLKKRKMTHTEETWRNRLDLYVLDEIGKMPVDRVTVRDVTRCLDPLFADRKISTLLETAKSIKMILDWAAAMGYRAPRSNPAVWAGHLDNIYPNAKTLAPVKHYPALPFNEMPTFFSSLRRLSGGPPDALAFTVLTATRSHNVLEMQWREIDWQTATWTIPAHDLKSRNGGFTDSFPVPLSAPALAILQARRPMIDNPQGCVFPGRSGSGGPLSADCMRKVLILLGYAENRKEGVEPTVIDSITVHGFRSSFADWADEAGKYSQRIIQAALQHKVELDLTAAGNMSASVVVAYRRNSALHRRRPLMDDWAAFCTSAMAPSLSLVAAA